MNRWIAFAVRYHLLVVGGIAWASYAYGLGPYDWRCVLAGAEISCIGHWPVYRLIPAHLQGIPYLLVLCACFLLFTNRYDRFVAAHPEPARGGRLQGSVTLGVIFGLVIAGASLHAGTHWLKPQIENYLAMHMAKCQKKMRIIHDGVVRYAIAKKAGPGVALDLDQIGKDGYYRTQYLGVPWCQKDGTYEVRLKAGGDGGIGCDVRCTVHGEIAGTRMRR